MKTIAEIAQNFIALARHLHSEGISYHASLTELTWLWLLKILPPQSLIPTSLTWKRLMAIEGLLPRYEFYQQALQELGQLVEAHPFNGTEQLLTSKNLAPTGNFGISQHYSFEKLPLIYAQARSVLKNPKHLAQLVDIIADIENLPRDEWGEFYDLLLEKGIDEQDNRWLRVPRCLLDLLVILIQPQPGELIQDPLAGTGRLLVATVQYLQVMEEEVPLKPYHFLAIEPDLTRQRLALMNSFLHGIIPSPQVAVHWGNSLLQRQNWPLADVILSMLVFTGEPELEKHEASLALLQHICQTLKPGGRAAVIIADQVLKATGPAQLVRTYLLNTCILHTVLRLPYGIFYPNKVTAHVLFFRRSQSLEEKTQQIWFYDLRHQFPIFGQYFQLRRQHLRAFEKLYGEDALGMSPRQTTDSRWHCFNREVIASQGDKLDLSRYLPPNEGQEEQFANVWELLAETVEGLEELAKILC